MVTVRWKRLAPEACVVAVEAGAKRSTGNEQLGARVVVAVGVHSIGEGVDVREVTPPRLVMILRGRDRSGREGGKGREEGAERKSERTLADKHTPANIFMVFCSHLKICFSQMIINPSNNQTYVRL